MKRNQAGSRCFFYVKRFIHDNQFRAVMTLVGSIIASAFFTLVYLFYLVKAEKGNRLWYEMLFIWYAILLLARIILLWYYFKHIRNKKEGNPHEVFVLDMANSLTLFFLGSEMLVFTIFVYKYNVQSGVKDSLLVIANGIYITVKMVFLVIGTRKGFKMTSLSSFYRAKYFLSEAETILLYLFLFNRVYLSFGMNDLNLLHANFIEGLALGSFVIVTSFWVLFRTLRFKKRNKEAGNQIN